MDNVPEVGKKYHFFDDGKISPSRHYIAQVEQIIDMKEARRRYAERYTKPGFLRQLSVIWEEIKNQRDWIFAKETDYLVLCSIEGYSEHWIWFARTKNSGWFSLDIHSGLETGELDVDGSIYEDAKNLFDDEYWYGWYDEESKTEIIDN